MPDLSQVLRALALAAATAAGVLLISGWPWRAPRQRRVALGWVLGVSAGFYLGCRTLGLWPHWPPREDQDRFLALLLPAVIVVELGAALLSRRWWLAWPLRLMIAAGAARLLLHNTVYLADLAGPDTAKWSPVQARLTLAVLAALLAATWAALALLAHWAPGRSVPLALALTCAGAGVTVMFSGYFTGGQLGLPLAAALVGATAASLAFTVPQASAPVLGFGMVGLFGLLVIGRFFGELTTAHALLLLGAPLLGWLPELPGVRKKLRPAVRGFLRVALIMVPVILVVIEARANYLQDSQADTYVGPTSIPGTAGGEKTAAGANESAQSVY